MADGIVAEAPAADGGAFFIDCPRALAKTLVDKLNFYKLRAPVTVEDLSEALTEEGYKVHTATNGRVDG